MRLKESPRRKSANNAASISGFAPLLALGLPGSPTTAILLAGFMMWGIRPGPMLFQSNSGPGLGALREHVYGQCDARPDEHLSHPAFVTVLRIPYTILMGFIVVFSSIGRLQRQQQSLRHLDDAGLGRAGLSMKKLKYPIVPLVLAMVLGRLAENSFRQALEISAGSYAIFYTKPITLIFLLTAILAYCTP